MSAELGAGFATLERLEGQRTSLLRNFAVSVFLSTIVIGASVVLLALTPSISRASCAASYLVGGCIGFCVCLLLYSQLLLRQLPWQKA